MTTKRAESYRSQFLVEGYQSREGDLFGCFTVPSFNLKYSLRVICAPCDEEWQHVSVSVKNKTPSWDDMCKIKDLFWDDNEIVIQFHPKKEDYVNNHKYCLHLWAKKDQSTPTPPKGFV